jgi:hypothetical protein
MLSNEEIQSLGPHAHNMLSLYAHIEKKGYPLHDGQIKIAKEFFYGNRDVMMCQWGRNGGKTLAILYIVWVYCLLNPGKEVYIIAPQAKQGKKIYWQSNRLQTFGPYELILEPRASEIRLVFHNGSSVTVDGCENVDGLRGIKPDLTIYDEFQDHSKDFHLNVMEPNLLGKSSKLLIMGTPPKKKTAFYVDFRENLLAEIKRGDTTRFYLELPTWINPIISKERLAKVKNRLISSGDRAIWEREYEGKMVFGGEDSVFPTWDAKRHKKKHNVLMDLVKKDARRMKWYTIADPGSSSCFGVLFNAYDPYTSRIFTVGELYEKDRKKTDSVSMWKRITEKQQLLNPDVKWQNYYDEAATWFANEVFKHFRISITPTKKLIWKNKEDMDGISLAKTVMSAQDLLLVSDECVNFEREIDSYITDEHGNYPDKDDHLIQCFIYFLYACNIKFDEKSMDELEFVPDVHNNSRIKIRKITSADYMGWDEQALEDMNREGYLAYDA